MRKPSSLRAHLAAATPELRRDPDKLSIFVRQGKLVTAGAHSLSFEYRYTLSLVVLDYAGHADAIMVPLLAWLRREQIEIFDNPELREKSLRFEVEFINKETVDITIEIDLTEPVIVAPGTAPASPDTTQRYTVTHAAEPDRMGAITMAEHWQAWFEGEMMAEWDFAPTEP